MTREEYHTIVRFACQVCVDHWAILRRPMPPWLTEAMVRAVAAQPGYVDEELEAAQQFIHQAATLLRKESR